MPPPNRLDAIVADRRRGVSAWASDWVSGWRNRLRGVIAHAPAESRLELRPPAWLSAPWPPPGWRTPVRFWM
jgi:hypothetical protein